MYNPYNPIEITSKTICNTKKMAITAGETYTHYTKNVNKNPWGKPRNMIYPWGTSSTSIVFFFAGCIWIMWVIPSPVHIQHPYEKLRSRMCDLIPYILCQRSFWGVFKIRGKDYMATTKIQSCPRHSKIVTYWGSLIIDYLDVWCLFAFKHIRTM
jgi:hypothetical protein